MSFPSLDHITLDDTNLVYEPSDDTFLLCDALESDKLHLIQIKPCLVMEIGSGSGCVITMMNTMLKSENIHAMCFATDINEMAAHLTKRTADANNNSLEISLSNLASCYRPQIIDILIFNPPYVPTPSEEVGSHGIEAAWAGGIDGREVIDTFIPIMHDLLSPGGCCYLLLVHDNKPKDIQRMVADIGMTSKVILSRQARNEHLLVLRIDQPSAK